MSVVAYPLLFGPRTEQKTEDAPSDDLNALAKELKRCVEIGASGPLALAPKVIAVADTWESFGEDTEGLTCDAWLRKYVSPTSGLSWWARRHVAVQLLGDSVRRKMHHVAACWIVSSTPPDFYSKIVKEVMKRTAQQGGVPLTVDQVQRLAAKIVPPAAGKEPTRAELLARIAELEAENERLRSSHTSSVNTTAVQRARRAQ